MAFVVTPGAADANSYSSLEFADAYHVSAGNITWSGTDDQKKGRLVKATTWLDAVYGHRFPGERTNGRSQSLRLPVKDAKDSFGQAIDPDTIPAEAQTATAEIALMMQLYPKLFAVTDPNRRIIREKVGPLERQFSDRGSALSRSPAQLLPLIDGILLPLIGRSGRQPAVYVV